MNECQSMNNYKTSSLPGNTKMKHQRSFNSSTRPALPPPPLTRANTISVSTTDNTAATKNSKEFNSLLEQKRAKQISPEHESEKCDSNPLVETRQVSQSFSHSTTVNDKSTDIPRSSCTPSPVERDSTSPMPISPTEKEISSEKPVVHEDSGPSTSTDHLSRPPPPTTRPPDCPSHTPSPKSISPVERDSTSPMPISPTDTTDKQTVTNGDEIIPDESNNVSTDTKPLTRPPRPTTKPPSRPSRPFPPPPQARLLEARLAKKKPPPTGPVTVIDTRSTKTTDDATDDHPNTTTSSTKDLKELRIECSNFSSLPRRPPPPLNSPVKKSVVRFSVDENNDADKETISSPVSPTLSSSLKDKEKVESQNKASSSVSFEEKDEEMDDLKPLPSPQKEGKKFVNKMKSSFRSLTQRRKRKGDETGSPSSQRIASDRMRRVSDNSMYDQQRYPDVLQVPITGPHYRCSPVLPGVHDNKKHKLPVGIISPLVVQCVGYLNQQECLDEPGLFRIPGDMSVMKQYRVSFARGEEVNFSECRDPHTVAGLLKLHFREQRQCIIPGDALVNKISQAVEDRDVQEFKTLIESVDIRSQAGIRMLAELLKKITDNSDINHMTSGTLATSCGPSFFPRIPPSCANAVLKFMTDNCDIIFGT